VIEGDTKSCLFCGGKCVLYLGQMWKFEEKTEAEYDIKTEKKEIIAEEPQAEYVYTKLGTADFIAALTYPLRFPLGLLTGGVMFSVLVFGLIVTSFKGGGLLAATLALAALLLMLKFGVLSRCFENFLQNTFKTGYMPRIKKFAVFEDFINPFFMGVKTYLIAFGLFTVLVAALFLYARFSFANDLDAAEIKMMTAGTQVSSALDSDWKAREIRENELRKMVNQARLSQMETVFGSNHLIDNRELEKAVKSVSRLTVYYQMPVIFAFILGVLFFPAACLTIGRNHSLSLKQRLICGFKEIKTVGFDYIKILLLCFVLLVVSLAAIFGLNLLFSYLHLPIAGILAAVITGSFLIFYFWTVFSSILAITISDRTENQTKNYEADKFTGNLGN
jgi:hypothetical protein